MNEIEGGEIGAGDCPAAGGLPCMGTDETIPFCNGRDCPEWGDCHGDRLRGYSVSDWRERLGNV